MDNLVSLDTKIQIAFAILVVVALTFFVICFAWLWPFIPYPGVSYDGVPWVNFRQFLFVFGSCASVFAITRAYRKKWIRDAKREEARRYGPATTVAQAEKKEPVIGIDEAMKKVAREAAEEVAEERGGEK
ncbi:MAG TPA: hypothetical protein PLA19_04285 [Candidatus Pacearchaeota archaeon]|nr:hypothetical protein [Candidatus Pacearchaeota archaeon]